MFDKVLNIVLILVLAAFALPIGINLFVDTDTSGWTGVFAPVASIWALPVIGAMLAIVVLVFKMVQSHNSD